MSETFEPPIKYLRNCSENSLRQYELAKLEHVSNLRRELRALWEEMTEESALALLARWILENCTEIRGTLRPAEPASAMYGDPLAPVFAAFDRCATQPEGEGSAVRPVSRPPSRPPSRPGRPRLVEQCVAVLAAQSGSAEMRSAVAGGTQRGRRQENEGNGSRPAHEQGRPVLPDAA
ncbi:MAG: hypothetical protein GZ088_13220 [Acidipila sp.]|nr:hypothetical protein [Acidipila sp.]